MSKTAQAAQALLQQFRNKEKYLLDANLLPQNATEAYAVQTAFQDALSPQYGPVAGYKIAYTTAALQQASGISEPASGVILAHNIRHSPAILNPATFLQPGIECEVAARLAADLPAHAAPYDRNTVSEAVDALMPAFEVVDNRRTLGQNTQTQLLTTIASNILNAGVVLGNPVTDWRSIHLAACRGYMTINNHLAGQGTGADVMGHPLEPLAWLANHLAARGQELKAGMIIITGSIVPPQWLNPGDSALIGIDGLGQASLTVQ